MADLIIPPPDAAGYWHFVYRTTDMLDGRWYGGKRSTKKHPLSDRYLGSGNWIKKHPARERLKREVVAFYPGSVEVFAGEAELITWTMVWDDPLCMNLRDGGEGVSVEAALLRYADPERRADHAAMLRRITSDPKVQAKMSASALLRFKNPEEHAKQTAHMRRITSDSVLLAKARTTRETPEWLANVTAANQLTHSTQEWKDAHAAGMQRAQTDPAWQEAMASKNRRMATDPAWRAANAAGSAKRSANSVWRENHAAAMRSHGAARRKAKPEIDEAAHKKEVSAIRRAAALCRWDAWRAAKASST